MNEKKGLTAYELKLIAIAAMLIDHIAWAFVPTYSVAGLFMHLIGRFTAPIMCYFIAEGYHYTHDVKKYAGRLAVFAIISYVPFILFQTGKLPNAQNMFNLNMIYTLFLGLLALIVQDNIQRKWVRILLTILLCILAIPGDWMFFAIFFILSFGKNDKNSKKQIKWYLISACSMMGVVLLQYIIVFSWYITGSLDEMVQQGMLRYVPGIWEFIVDVGMQSGMFLVLLLLKQYNGQKGGGTYSKWIFYMFYPLHLILLAAVKIWIL